MDGGTACLKQAAPRDVKLSHHLCDLAAGGFALAAGFGAQAAVFHVGKFLALGGAHATGVSAQSAGFSVQRRPVAHQRHARLTGRAAVKTGFKTRFHAGHSDTLRRTRFAFGEAVQAVCDTRLHFRRHCRMARRVSHCSHRHNDNSLHQTTSAR